MTPNGPHVFVIFARAVALAYSTGQFEAGTRNIVIAEVTDHAMALRLTGGFCFFLFLPDSKEFASLWSRPNKSSFLT
jgi:hypothetical protein